MQDPYNSHWDTGRNLKVNTTTPNNSILNHLVRLIQIGAGLGWPLCPASTMT